MLYIYTCGLYDWSQQRYTRVGVRKTILFSIKGYTMSKVFKLIVATSALTMLSLAAPAPARAACEIENTGPGSVNECVNVADFSCELSNDNQIIIRNDSEQVAQSGPVEAGEGAFSGTVTNDNGTTFSVTIENEGCVVTAVTTPQPPVEETPVVPQPVVEPPKKETPKVLAKTSSSNLIVQVVAGVMAASLVAAGAIYVTKKTRGYLAR